MRSVIGLFAFASCSILTTMPNAVTSAIHDRMPVILDCNDYDLWLDPGMCKSSRNC
jgi:putative SOS response-associated peptidase YedK